MVVEQAQGFLDCVDVCGVLSERLVTIRLADQALYHIPGIAGCERCYMCTLMGLQRILIASLEVRRFPDQIVHRGVESRTNAGREPCVVLLEQQKLCLTHGQHLRVSSSMEELPACDKTRSQGLLEL